MSDASSTPSPGSEHLERLRTDLQDAAQRLRQTHRLDDDERARLAELIDELGQALGPEAPPDALAHLAETASTLAKALHDHEEEGTLSHLRDRLDEAAAHAEVDAPWATSIVRRFLDLLAQIGI